MPTQLPRESTDLFAEVLYPHTLDILKSDAKKPLENHQFTYPIYSVCLPPLNSFVREIKLQIFNIRALWRAMENSPRTSSTYRNFVNRTRKSLFPFHFFFKRRQFSNSPIPKEDLATSLKFHTKVKNGC